MRVALTVWKDSISTVFDTAEELLVLEKTEGEALHRSTARFSSTDVNERAKQMKMMGIDVLICGAISRPTEAVISASGITVVPFVRGCAWEVFEAYLSGQLETGSFALPGCRKYYMHKWRCEWPYLGEPILKKGQQAMNPLTQGGSGRGMGRGLGMRRGRMGSPKAAGPIGQCICPHCGYKEQHERGVPCWQKKCPQCGTPMIRE